MGAKENGCNKTLVNELKGEMSDIYMMTFFIERWGIFNVLCVMNFIGCESTHHKAQDKQPHELKTYVNHKAWEGEDSYA
jgi:hypothetical protein